MGKINLNKRESGALFAPFERELIWGYEHIGWVHWTGRNKFILRKSPFSNHTSRFEYLTPPDICPPENEFIEVEVGNLIGTNPRLTRGTTFVEFSNQYYEVMSYKPASLKKLLHTPYLKRDDFLHHITYNWRDAESDHLDISLALQILSCPESVYGKGGIGTQSINLHSAMKKPYKDFKSTINLLLPTNFREKNRVYEYDFIEKYADFNMVIDRRNSTNCSELSYNYLDFIPQQPRELIPIQVPTVIQNAEYREGTKYFDPDVLEYLLTALMIRPPFNENMINELREGLILVREEVNPYYAGDHVPFDENALAKLANAFCRLELKEQLTPGMFSKAKKCFLELYHEFYDARETLFSREDDRSWITPSVRVSYANLQLDANDLSVLREIIRTNREQGLRYVPVEEIRRSQRIANLSDYELHSSLQRLVEAGQIIHRMNYTEFMPLFYDAED